MKKIISDGALQVKDENGLYMPLRLIKPAEAPSEVSAPMRDDISIDDELKRGLVLIHRILTIITVDVGANMITPETVGNLKKCMDMLMDLKAKEKEFLDKLSEEDLKKLLKDI